MNLSAIPQRLALIGSLVAFLVVWTVGLAADVALHTISLRAVIAAAFAWALGYLAGKAVVNALCDAMVQHLYEKDKKRSPASPDGGPK